MRFPQRTRAFVRSIAVVMALATPVMLAASLADARPGGGSSSGSRGSRTFSAPPSTATSPNAARPMERSMTQPGTPSVGAPAAAAANRGGFFNRPGLLGGLAAGFLGAGLFGMLFGGGLGGGLGGLSSMIGLLFQIALIGGVAYLALAWWRRRNAPAMASGPARFDAQDQQQSYQNQTSQRSGFGFGLGANAAPAPLEIQPADYEAFEKLLGDIQTAWSKEDVAKLHTLATPEMVSYFSEDLIENSKRGVVNTVTDVKLLQGDLSEAWREGSRDYATVALRFGFIEKTVERAGGKIVDGSDQPIEATEIWTFVREANSSWELSAIQQT